MIVLCNLLIYLIIGTTNQLYIIEKTTYGTIKLN